MFMAKVSSNKPALLKVISKKWVVHIPQPPLDYALHGLKQKRLVLGIDILNPLQRKYGIHL